MLIVGGKVTHLNPSGAINTPCTDERIRTFKTLFLRQVCLPFHHEGNKNKVVSGTTLKSLDRSQTRGRRQFLIFRNKKIKTEKIRITVSVEQPTPDDQQILFEGMIPIKKDLNAVLMVS